VSTRRVGAGTQPASPRAGWFEVGRRSKDLIAVYWSAIVARGAGLRAGSAAGADQARRRGPPADGKPGPRSARRAKPARPSGTEGLGRPRGRVRARTVRPPSGPAAVQVPQQHKAAGVQVQELAQAPGTPQQEGAWSSPAGNGARPSAKARRTAWRGAQARATPAYRDPGKKAGAETVFFRRHAVDAVGLSTACRGPGPAEGSARARF